MKKVLLVLSVVFVGCTEKPKIDKSRHVADKPAASQVSVVDAAPDIKPQIEELKPLVNWKYDQTTDEMRGTKSKFASITSDNSVQFGFPYDGGSYLSTTLRKRSNEPTEVMFAISDGQYSCDTISDNCFAAVKFDNGDIQNIELSSTTDYSSDVLFIANEYDVDSFVASLKSSKKLIVELPFYQEGKKQFGFTVSGLNWGKSE